MEPQSIKISQLEYNEGQIKGLPRNPRRIEPARYEKLKQSICDAPEMLEMRSLIVVKHGEKFVVICGNMRLKACIDLDYEELPCYILPEDTPVKKLQEYTIKDNIGFGVNDWEALSTEWDTSLLDNWGLDFTDWEEKPAEAENLYLEGNGEHGGRNNTIKVGRFVCYLSDDEMQEMLDWVDEYVKYYGTSTGFFSQILEKCRR